MRDFDRMATEVVAAAQGFVSRAVAGFGKRLDELEQRIAEIPAGPAGKDGAPGRDGEKGLDGVPGKDGERGAEGAPGKDGAPGRDGVDGKDGADGLSAMGEKGADGRDGKDGRDGREGKDGTPGRDAADIEPLPAIDASKSYPRGTWAKHAGGLWLARTPTDGMAGWDCVVDGLASVAALAGADQRSFTLDLRTSSGKAVQLPFTLPVMLYKGTWREGERVRGDTVTWDGSLWHCEADKTTEKPGTTATDWKLCAKRGQNGKDGKDGIQGKEGPTGRAGRDLTQMAFDGTKY